jgi:hypothetical protein
MWAAYPFVHVKAGCGPNYPSLWFPGTDINLDALAYQLHSGFVRRRGRSQEPEARSQRDRRSQWPPRYQHIFAGPCASVIFRLRSSQKQKSGARSQKSEAPAEPTAAALPTYFCRSLCINNIPASFVIKAEVRSQKPEARSQKPPWSQLRPRCRHISAGPCASVIFRVRCVAICCLEPCVFT